MKPALKAPGYMHLKLRYDGPLSDFAFDFNLRRYTVGALWHGVKARGEGSGQGPTLVPISAQLELTLPISAQLELTWSPTYPNLTHGCVPKVHKLISHVSNVFPKVLELSSEVSECKPLAAGAWRCWGRARWRMTSGWTRRTTPRSW